VTEPGASTTDGRVDNAFRTMRERGAKGIVPFVCAGFPSLDSTTRALIGLARVGATLIEVGIPFSDPIADGPTIASAMHDALEHGVTPALAFDAVREARAKSAMESQPIVAMVSASIVWRIGPEPFAERARDAGFDGVILPDVPLEASPDLTTPFRDLGMTATLLVAPTTPDERAAEIARASTGFVYVLARVGITGASGDTSLDSSALRRRIDLIREGSDLPVCVGFGISTPQDVHRVVHDAGADGAIVGSELVRRMGRAGESPAEAAGAAESFLRSLQAGLR